MKTASIPEEQKQAVAMAPQSPPKPHKNNPFALARKRKIGPADVNAIAELCAMRLTEKEACDHLLIDYTAWRNWKARHNNASESFDCILSRVRTAKVTGLIKGIERHGVGADGLRADWRALDRVLVITDQRYSDRAPATVDNDTAAIADDLLARMIARAYNVSTDRTALQAPKDDPEKSAEVVEIQAVETKEGE